MTRLGWNARVLDRRGRERSLIGIGRLLRTCLLLLRLWDGVRWKNRCGGGHKLPAAEFLVMLARSGRRVGGGLTLMFVFPRRIKPASSSLI
jgi:hypothetical protein